MNAAATYLAVQLARIESESALPNAPLVGGRRDPSARQPVRTARLATARALRQAANRLAPTTTPACG